MGEFGVAVGEDGELIREGGEWTGEIERLVGEGSVGQLDDGESEAGSGFEAVGDDGEDNADHGYEGDALKWKRGNW